MKTPSLPSVLRSLLVCGLTLLGAGISPADLLVSNSATGKISRYRNDGSLLKSSFISGLTGPTTIHVTGSHIYVACTQAGTVVRYNLDGTPSKVPFVTGLAEPVGLTSDGTALYVSNYRSGRIGKYNLLTGAVINANFISSAGPFQGLHYFKDTLVVTMPDEGAVKQYSSSTGGIIKIVASDLVLPTAVTRDAAGNLFVADLGTSKVSKYNVSLGLTDAAFIATGPENPTSLAFVGKDLAVVGTTTGKISLYNASGKLLKRTFIDAGERAFGIAVMSANTPYPLPTLSYKGSKSILTSKSTVTLKGTSKNATVVEVKLTSGKKVKLPKASSWSYTAKLKEGKNSLSITSRGAGGTSKAVKVIVTRKSKKASALFGGE